MNNLDTSGAQSVGSMKEAPPQMKAAIGIISLLISFLLLAAAVDRVFSTGLIWLTKMSTTAAITETKEIRSRNSKSYWISYEFQVGGQTYERRSLFGLMRQGTRIQRTDVGALQPGSSIAVNYSKLNPRINESQQDPYKYDKAIFMVVGIFLFGLLGVNEVKGFLKRAR